MFFFRIITSHVRYVFAFHKSHFLLAGGFSRGFALTYPTAETTNYAARTNFFPLIKCRASKTSATTLVES